MHRDLLRLRRPDPVLSAQCPRADRLPVVITPSGRREDAARARAAGGDVRAIIAGSHWCTDWGRDTMISLDHRVCSWLIGPFIDAWLEVGPDDRVGARRVLDGFVPHLDEACIGTISEVFDAIGPYTPRGGVAQAWSVAEILRCWVLTAEPGVAPRDP